MPRETALDPVVTRTGTTKVAAPTVAKVTEIPLEPICRLITGDQYVYPEVAT